MSSEVNPSSPPYKLLLDNTARAEGRRSKEQLDILIELLQNNVIFKQLNLPSNAIQQLCNHMVLIWAQDPHIIQSNNLQAYFILEGKGFQYMDNQDQAAKAKYFQGNDYLLVRKLGPADCFIVHFPHERFHGQSSIRKYQLMIDQGTLVGKIEGEQFYRLLEYHVAQRHRRMNSLFKKIQSLNGLPNAFFTQIGMHLEQFSFSKDQQIIKKTEKDPFVYFIEKGSIEIILQKILKIQKSPIRKVSFMDTTKKFEKRFNLGENQILGIEPLITFELGEEEQFCFSVKAAANCTLFKIEKRIFAMIISSFEQIIKRKDPLLSSVNLNDQIQGSENEEKNYLIQNANKIRNSEKKARDLKLRLFDSPHKKKIVNIQANFTENNSTFYDTKFKSTHNFSNIKIDSSNEQRFSKTLHTRFSSVTYKRDMVQSKIYQIEVEPAQQSRNYTSMGKELPKFARTHIKKKSETFMRAMEEDNIVRAFIQNKLKNEMMKKAGLILQRNMNHQKAKISQPAKRVFSLKQIRARSQDKGRYSTANYRPLTQQVTLSGKTIREPQVGNLSKYLKSSSGQDKIQLHAQKIIEKKIKVSSMPFTSGQQSRQDTMLIHEK